MKKMYVIPTGTTEREICRDSRLCTIKIKSVPQDDVGSSAAGRGVEACEGPADLHVARVCF